jgi:N-methylhydantoinase A
LNSEVPDFGSHASLVIRLTSTCSEKCGVKLPLTIAAAARKHSALQAITYRVRGRGVLPFSPELPPLEKADGDPQPATTRPVYLEVGQGFVDTPIYDYATLRAGHVITGPAVIEVPTTTVVVPGGRTGTVDDLGNLHIRPTSTGA